MLPPKKVVIAFVGWIYLTLGATALAIQIIIGIQLDRLILSSYIIPMILIALGYVFARDNTIVSLLPRRFIAILLINACAFSLLAWMYIDQEFKVMASVFLRAQ